MADAAVADAGANIERDGPPAPLQGVRRRGFAWGTVIGTLGGLIGLGGAEFRLPVLLALFRLGPLAAILVNLQVSLVTVTAALLFRGASQGFGAVFAHLPVALALLAGALLGAWLGAAMAGRIDARRLRQIIGVLLIGLAGVMLAHDALVLVAAPDWPAPVLFLAGLLAGVGIGIVSSLLGVAGGELLIPALMFLYGLDIKLAGTISLAISLPTLLVGLMRYRRQGSFGRPDGMASVPGGLVSSMAAGSVLGALIGSLLFLQANASLLHLVLGVILLVSALKLLWMARRA